MELGKKDKGKSKALRTSASNGAISAAAGNGSVDPRAGMVYHQSDSSGECYVIAQMKVDVTGNL